VVGKADVTVTRCRKTDLPSKPAGRGNPDLSVKSTAEVAGMLLVVEKLPLRCQVGLCSARKRNVERVSLVHDAKADCGACKLMGCV